MEILNRLRDKVILMALIGYVISILELLGVFAKIGIEKDTMLGIATLVVTGILTAIGIVKQPNSTKQDV